MLLDYTIRKPKIMGAYDIHRLVMGIFGDGKDRPLFCDLGDRVLVRTPTPPSAAGIEGTEVAEVREGDVRCIELRASCYVSVGGKKYFAKPGDWKARHDWLRKKGLRHGFEVLSVNYTSKPLKVQKPGAPFVMDCTDFTACIKVTDEAAFGVALHDGIGAKGRAFGFGLVVF